MEIRNKTNVLIVDMKEYEDILAQVEEFTYRIWSPELLNKSMESFELATLEINAESGEQDRLKALCEEGVWGVKKVSNLPKVMDRW